MVGMILFINYRHEVDSHQQLFKTTQQIAVASILDSYQQMIEVIFEERFNTPLPFACQSGHGESL